MSLELALEAVNRTLKLAEGVELELGGEVALLVGLWLALKGVEQAASRDVSRISGNGLLAFRLGDSTGTRLGLRDPLKVLVRIPYRRTTSGASAYQGESA